MNTKQLCEIKRDLDSIAIRLASVMSIAETTHMTMCGDDSQCGSVYGIAMFLGDILERLDEVTSRLPNGKADVVEFPGKGAAV